MGILADLFVSTPSEALEYETSQLQGRAAHVARYNPAEYKRLTSLEFGTLWAILVAEEWDFERHKLEDVLSGETWLCRFPDEYAAALAALTPENVEAASDAWAQTEELAMSGFEPEHSREVLEDLVRLAREAQARDRSLYLWGSL